MTLTNTQRITALEARMTAHETAHKAGTIHSHVAPAPVPDPSVGALLFEDFLAPGLPGTLAQNYRPSGPTTVVTKDATLISCPGDGFLHLRAVRQADGTWRSCSVDTKLSKKQLYGIFEARIKVPKGRGLWPAGPWGYDDATSQEIDGMEILANPVGTMDADHDVQALHCTVHMGSWQSGVALRRGIDLSADFHVYGFEWRRDRITWLLDGAVVRTFTDAAHIPNVPLPLIVDLGVGGWAGAPDSTTPSPSEMLIDWVRIKP